MGYTNQMNDMLEGADDIQHRFKEHSSLPKNIRQTIRAFPTSFCCPKGDSPETCIQKYLDHELPPMPGLRSKKDVQHHCQQTMYKLMFESAENQKVDEN